jgi:hypothetical protein
VERRFQARLEELLDDAEVPLSLLRGALPRLGEFLQPFLNSLIAPQRANALDYVEGLLSDLQSKDAESIAYLHDRERQGIQKFLGQADWDHRPLIAELARQVGERPGEAYGVLVFDPPPSPSAGPSRWGWRGSGAAGWARSRTARSASTSATSRTRDTPWSISASTWASAGPAPASG